MKTLKILMVVLLLVPIFAGSVSAKMVAHYKFEGNANDSVGGNQGSEFGGPTYVGGAFGQAINLDGVNDYVDCSNSPVFDITKAITVACWVNIDAVPADWAGIVTKGDSSWRLSNAWRERRFHFAVTSVNSVNGDTTIPAGEWHHVCGTFDGSVIRIYVDGVEDNKIDYTGSISTNGFNVWIGANSERSGRCWDGRIDDVRIYDQALSAEDVARLAKAMRNAFTYQGRLLDSNKAADGLYDFKFKLYGDASGGAQKGLAIEVNEVDVIDGYFTAEVDFGSDVFDGTDCWLEIGVRAGALKDPNVYTVLIPRQRITPAPYALYTVSPPGIYDVLGTPSLGEHLPGDAGGMPVYNLGNVGIGMLSPRCPLSIMRESEQAQYTNNLGTDFGIVYAAGGPLRLTIGSESGTPAAFITAQTHSDLYLGGNNAIKAVTITNKVGSAGNVGIGMTNPSAKLDVNGVVNTSSVYKISGGTVLSISGTSNTLVGIMAGANNTGSYNTFSGYQAGYPNTTGVANTFSGCGAGTNNTTGNSNTYVGSYAGMGNTTGNWNTVIGACSSGYVVTGSGNVFIGYNAGSYETGSNKLYIANSSGTPLIYGDFSTGNVGIGTTSPGEALELKRNNTDVALRILYPEIAEYKIGINGGESVLRIVNANGPVDIGATTKGIMIDTTGNVGIGVSSPSEKLDVDGTARLRGIGSSSGTTVVADGNGKLWKQSSSQRYKTNIEALDADTDAVLKLRPVRFQWKTTGQNDIGLIAEEVEQQLSDLVIYDNEGRPEAVKYDKVSLYLLAVVKDLKAENESLKQRLTSLETTVEQLTKGKEFEP